MSKIARLMCAVVVVALAATACWAQEGVTLALKFTPGETQEYDVSFSGSGGLRAPDGQMSAMGVRGTCGLTVKVLEVRPDGSARLELQIPRIEAQATVGDQQARFSFANGQMRWYSNGKEQAPPEAAQLSQAPMLGVPLEVVASPRGQILDVVLPNLQNLAGMQQMVPGLGTPNLSNLGKPIFPEGPVAVGTSWRDSVTMTPLGPTMPVWVVNSHTLDSYTDTAGMGLAKISGHSEATFRMNPMNVGPAESQVTVSVPDMKYMVTSTEFFNTTEGRLVRGDYSSSFMSNVAFSGGGQGPQQAGLEARFSATVQGR
jgi:hypothetical protein